MKINSKTKISKLIQENYAVIEALVSLNPQFEKLRNPLLRKVLAPRVTIANAAKIGGTEVEQIFEKLAQLGFYIEETETKEKQKDLIPEFYKTITKDQVQILDVRTDISNGKDPFKRIMDMLTQLPADKILKLVNTFEPTPLISILSKKGYISYVIQESTGVVNTYIKSSKNQRDQTNPELKYVTSNSEEIEKILSPFKQNIIEIDVREMEAPMPMVTVLEKLDSLLPDTLLKVNHSRVPFILFTELDKRGFQYKYQKISEEEILILIFKTDGNN